MTDGLKLTQAEERNRRIDELFRIQLMSRVSPENTDVFHRFCWFSVIKSIASPVYSLMNACTADSALPLTAPGNTCAGADE